MSKKWNAVDVEKLIEIIDEPDRKVTNGKYSLSELQAKAILELRLHRLTGLERNKIHSELKDLTKKITDFLKILSSRKRLYSILTAELMEMKEKFSKLKV